MDAEKMNKILIAEDDASISRLIAYKFEKEDYEIKVIEAGDKVLAEIKSDSYDALVLDLMLPVLDGMQVLKRIRKAEIKLPILVLSAKSQEEDILKALSAGADEYLTKPFRPDELLLRVKKMLGD
ncbi:response regulator receiver domain-containing protein [Halanaerobium saccharolyticum]|uniref:Stage 0 sporulation protein A homolog n=1 Tax=Halanaerobium saccharolyticum TaxID=43595 RepID=A0A4R7YUV3_9FIRM|nr:response regulator transcription factor [Halanaerobium saccharolyticum]RAK06368.1 response regulator receiver domain-containing protein [Halanaerobium saccharolyticum]TDW00680.1 response regulator receiver domain-containing protein [Halanaerobium saccharolyticum]TDX52293.1 response regulator receiver domain-containing protein [Halanaerobium saccharolyticum]